ncbi:MULTISPECIES: hypothetical protein [unclassified Janthinobacterium]|uniref:hypothetical protein n=1 Tax=unclassified Janthinobacterium TaxID=2610881 RepID=UPI00034CEB9E|nr:MULTISPECIES: hypothetical protein [unclassified Janthinobacterium]MEC5159720.1 hypothetical protein [Janthinobacterium sp. CG_S6]
MTATELPTAAPARAPDEWVRESVRVNDIAGGYGGDALYRAQRGGRNRVEC